MKFDLDKSIEILERTPKVIEDMLNGVSEDWVVKNEGPDTWSPYDIVGHLIHGEKTDWIARVEIILSDKPNKKFQTFDRFAQFRESEGKTLQMLIDEFKTLRKKNIIKLRLKEIDSVDLTMKGIHPAFGKVTLKQLLSTWVVHDLNHIAQIARVMSKQYKTEVGPWIDYLPILTR
jgi:DinB superfamily